MPTALIIVIAIVSGSAGSMLTVALLLLPISWRDRHQARKIRESAPPSPVDLRWQPDKPMVPITEAALPIGAREMHRIRKTRLLEMGMDTSPEMPIFPL